MPENQELIDRLESLEKKVATAVYPTWGDYSKAPEADRVSWAQANPEAFQKLAEIAKQRRF